MGGGPKPQSTSPNNLRTSSSTAASSASAYSNVTTSASSASGSASGHARTPSAEYRSGYPNHPSLEPERPESPLRKARSTPFIRRPVRYEPAQPILRQHRSIAPPLPPLPPLPPSPPVPPTTGRHPCPVHLASRAVRRTVRVRPARRSARACRPASPSARRLRLCRWPRRALVFSVVAPCAQPDRHSPSGLPSSSRISGSSSPRTPPNGGGKGHSSFMHITPEQPHSRMSRLWSRARAGLSKGPEQGKTDGMGKGELRALKGEGA
ncbi:uncharacterized protein B0H18DRAFT_411291 [Fomitopsis serialis]|uniref:uncharacterized protein n=1 Tax=Fomitopsis serialis TaxID=139415 RepID=UPI002008540B|nr:uncharacterized protein B0H18DRAFT_411291 [Neoantrodia serialis]KAH9935351.1 hypothetical protein B0H18DRAFT_411291 [Neoantrodia serialis]